MQVILSGSKCLSSAMTSILKSLWKPWAHGLNTLVLCGISFTQCVANKGGTDDAKMSFCLVSLSQGFLEFFAMLLPCRLSPLPILWLKSLHGTLVNCRSCWMTWEGLSHLHQDLKRRWEGGLQPEWPYLFLFRPFFFLYQPDSTWWVKKNALL